MRKYYDWHETFSRQTGNNGEICVVIGAKNIGKTFGLRRQCIIDYLKKERRFCEICRTKEERKEVRKGYFAKLAKLKEFENYVFDVEGSTGRIAKIISKDAETGEIKHTKWETICYFVALSAFQVEKKRTFENIYRYILDEGIIDKKDKYHRYLPNEYLILANLLDTISRQQPGGEKYRVYILGNACDLTSPYLRYNNINKIPEFGYKYFRNKTVLFHYVEPWDAEEMKTNTLVGRMLQGISEAQMIYENKFIDNSNGEVMQKTSNAKYLYAIKFNGNIFASWLDYSKGLLFITSKLPKNAKNIVTISKQDSGINYINVKKSDAYLRIVNEFFYHGNLRYESLAIRDMYMSILDFLGIK